MSDDDTPLGPLFPRDEHNQRLESNVHPPDWENPTPDGEPYNLVVIGAGTAGLVASSIAAGLGGKVALIERSLLGGDCLNVGCVPSKGIIAAARAAATVKKASEFGVEVEGVSIDFGKAMERMRKLRADISPHDSAARFRDLGMDVFIGQAEFKSPNTVEVAGETLTFKKAVIATGARASAPPIPGTDETPYLTNETLFSLTELPKRFGIVGAGPIGCEMAQTFARLGSEVFLIEAMPGILPREDNDAAKIVHEAMEQDGVKIICCGENLKLAPSGEHGAKMTLQSESGDHDIEVDRLLISVGRSPNVEGLGLEAAGVDFHKKGVTVNDRLQTSNPNVYAAGDICSPYQFTHAADFMARTVVQNALFFGRGKASALTIPWCTYTEPEIAHVGLYEKEAEEKGIEVTTFTLGMEKVDRALLDGETEGFVRVHTKAGSDKILGATVVGRNAGDLISQFSQAMTNKIGLKGVGGTISPYPTVGEAVRKTGDLYSRTRLTPKVQALMKKFLKWRRS